VPGRRPPVLVPQLALASLARGSVCVDLACGPQGGNVYGSIDGQRVTDENGVTVIGSSDLAATIPAAASRMFAKNIYAMVAALTHDARFAIDLDDELQRAVLACRDRAFVSPALRRALGLDDPEPSPVTADLAPMAVAS
jgi:H+-translocating NAD(P) transhydrogenase subunit alpha